MMQTNIILEKKSKFDPWTCFVDGAHSILQDTFNEGAQHIIEKNPDMNTDEAEEVTFDKLEPRYRAEAIGQYKAFLKFSKAMKKYPLHKKITDTAKRLRDEDDFDEDDALKCAIKKRRYLLDGKLEEFDPQTYSLGEDDESDSLQQSSGSKYAPSQLQQNNFGPKYTQSQLGSGSMFKTFLGNSTLFDGIYSLISLIVKNEQRDGPNPLSLYSVIVSGAIKL